jgi:predicted site-specific integrase-resolvase
MDDLSRQVDYLKRPEYIDYNIITDVASGINFQRKGLSTILEACLQKRIGEVVIANRDRLCRFGYELIDQLVKKGGGKITVLNDPENKSSEQELAEDLLAIIHIFSCKQMGRRRYAKGGGKDTTDKDISNQETERSTG